MNRHTPPIYNAHKDGIDSYLVYCDEMRKLTESGKAPPWPEQTILERDSACMDWLARSKLFTQGAIRDARVLLNGRIERQKETEK